MIILFTCLAQFLFCPQPVVGQEILMQQYAFDPCGLEEVICDGEDIPEIKRFILINAYVTGYNTVVGQTDGSPCISASGENICGVSDAAACPRRIPFGTRITIDGRTYRCVDRLALKFDDRFDISFQKDIKAARKFGIQIKEIKIWD